MSDTDKLNLKIDNRLDAYKTFFGHAWAKEITDLAEGTKLDALVNILTVNLRSAANCHTLPWLMMTSMSNLWAGFLTNYELQGSFIDTLATELPNRMKGSLSPSQQQEMGAMIRELAQRINEGLANHDLSLSPESLWKEYLGPKYYEWIFAIWGSQRLVFSGLFFAYESYVKDVVGIAKGDPDYKGFPWPKLVADTKQAFGENVGTECLEGEFIEITQFARHALAHNSGKETSKLKMLGDHGLDVIDGLLQIQCSDNATLCRGIEKRSLLLAEAAVNLPQFQLPPAASTKVV